MAGTGIMAGICTSPYPSPYPTEKVGDSPYPYPYPVNAGISRQNGDGFGRYPRGRVYLPSLLITSFTFLLNSQTNLISIIMNFDISVMLTSQSSSIICHHMKIY